ncbi:HlyB/MsbA family ABC transporter [Virgisporangium aliadipatigenens]|uniref:HlyB/MsbA family ABC transporter n=1 Tax=Virgisporangium aliadipatigenens TaxID=741659 RepID=A0A8J3YHE6_9ACTN|nr:ABC transporter ATP-binding protein [Virgisporangium aliadipatigenens]GIJ44253.1 HlyB/MsbA family ABC transporter [Virgisporangium aliadipatigenens]
MSTYRAVWSIVRRTPRLYALDILFQLLRNGIPLLPALIVREVFDRLTHGEALHAGFWALLAAFVGVAVARVAALLLSTGTDGTLAGAGQALLTRNYLERVLNQPGAEKSEIATGDLVGRVSNDTTLVMNAVVLTLVTFGAGAQAVLAFAIMFSIDPNITLIVFVPMVAAGFLINVTSNSIKKYHGESRQAAGDVSAFLREMFNSVQAVQLANATERVMDQFVRLNEIRRHRSLRSRLFTNVFLGSVWTNTAYLGTGIVLLLSAAKFKNGTFTLGDLVLFIAYLGWITDFTSLVSQSLASLKQAGKSLQRISDGLPAGDGLADLVTHRPTRPAPPETEEHCDRVEHRPLRLLEAQGLSYRYASSGRGVRDVDLRIPRGAFVVVTGGVGSGKTTLLRLVLGLLEPQAGTIRWNGAEVPDPAGFFVPPHSAYTPQVPRLMSATVRQNILLGLPDQQARMSRAVRSAVLERDVEVLDDGLDTMVGPKGAKLSGGQAQRVATARMFAREADLLVFDDLSSSLDVNTERLLWERLGERVDQTCLAVSNRRIAFERASHIVVMHNGSVEATGTFDQLRRNSPSLQRILHGDESPNEQQSRTT